MWTKITDQDIESADDTLDGGEMALSGGLLEGMEAMHPTRQGRFPKAIRGKQRQPQKEPNTKPLPNRQLTPPGKRKIIPAEKMAGLEMAEAAHHPRAKQKPTQPKHPSAQGQSRPVAVRFKPL